LLEIWIHISGITRDQPNVHMLEGEGNNTALQNRRVFFIYK